MVYSTENRNILLGDTLPGTAQKNKSSNRCSFAASVWGLAAITPAGVIACLEATRKRNAPRRDVVQLRPPGGLLTDRPLWVYCGSQPIS